MFLCTAFILLEFGAFISHATPFMITSAVDSPSTSLFLTNSTVYPAEHRASAVFLSCGQTLTPGS